jgi:hypothetical protein
MYILKIVLWLIITSLSLAVYYYVNLIFSKQEYSRNEFTNLIPFITFVFKKIKENISFIHIVIGLVLFVLPVLVLSLVRNWLVNSVILLAAAYYVYPLLMTYTAGLKEDDTFTAVVRKTVSLYYFGLYAFGTALCTMFTYNFFAFRNTGTIFFFVNFIAAFVLFYYMLGEIVHYNTVDEDENNQNQTESGSILNQDSDADSNEKPVDFIKDDDTNPSARDA